MLFGDKKICQGGKGNEYFGYEENILLKKGISKKEFIGRKYLLMLRQKRSLRKLFIKRLRNLYKSEKRFSKKYFLLLSSKQNYFSISINEYKLLFLIAFFLK